MQNDDAVVASEEYTYTLCLWVYTGTTTTRYVISNPDGISGFSEYQNANFAQRLLEESPTHIKVEITSQAELDTRARYPINIGTLPEDIRPYLLPQPGWIQSDDPEIVAKATELVEGVVTEVEAVEAILTWLRAYLVYDETFSLPNDAASVFRNRSGVCAGFSNLAVALLRAADIPSRVQSVCIMPGNGWHAVAEVYFPDAGWAISDPQGSMHYMPTISATNILVGGIDQCKFSNTSISVASQTGYQRKLFELGTPYDESKWYFLMTAWVPHLARSPIMITPAKPSMMLPITQPSDTLTLNIDNQSCWSQSMNWQLGWTLKTDSPWLSPKIITATTPAGTAQFTVDLAGMDPGFYTSTITAFSATYTDEYHYCGEEEIRTITVDLRLVDEIYKTYLPVVLH